MPPIPKILQDLSSVSFQNGEKVILNEEIRSLFPNSSQQCESILKKGEGKQRDLKIGILFSGGPAPGGHNVIVGIQHALSGGELIGFLNGPKGLIEKNFRKLQREEILSFRNTGGFDLLGSGRTKIETQEQLALSAKTASDLDLDGLVIIGGDDSNTNAAILAEYFLAKGCKTQVIGIPKTIDGDLQAKHVPISFGFDTACRTYSE
ncbi:MAG: 6-phosphofructokinase, partial [Chlamydiia bacterium]|nr:6-phosphofructokinase [Chlamydiia bacterium]